MSYHLKEINKGQTGQFSKIEEEFEEVLDALQQENKLMLLTELSDLIGAIEAYINNHFPNITLDDLLVMKDATKRAFESGRRY